MEPRHPHVVNIADVAARDTSHGKFASQARRLGAAAGSKKLGCSYFEVPPGKAAFPAHFHAANEEAIFVIDGEGTMRLGDARVPVKAGDYIAMPVGPSTAHQLVNTGAGTLKYLCFSTMSTVEVVGYPDSKKHAATAHASVEGALKGDPPWVRHIWTAEQKSAGYYDGEDG